MAQGAAYWVKPAGGLRWFESSRRLGGTPVVESSRHRLEHDLDGVAQVALPVASPLRQLDQSLAHHKHQLDCEENKTLCWHHPRTNEGENAKQASGQGIHKGNILEQGFCITEPTSCHNNTQTDYFGRFCPRLQTSVCSNHVSRRYDTYPASPSDR